MSNAQHTQTTDHPDESTPPSIATPSIATAPLWRLIPVHEYKSPPEPTSETLRSTLRNLRNWFRDGENESSTQTDTKAAPKLRTAPPGLLTWVAPDPAWENEINALDATLTPWYSVESRMAGIQALVGAPYSDLANIAVAWGKAHNFAIIKPPTPAQILGNDPDWMKQWQYNKADRLILPHLEQCYLRHPNGLDLIRRLLDWLWQAEIPCLIVSDSWAWSYLKRVHHLDALCHQPLTLAPLDAYALDRWLSTLANRDRSKNFIFREEKDGSQVLRYTAPKTDPKTDPGPATETIAAKPKTAKQKQEKPSEFIRYLAARSRGISGIAWAIWRHTLQIAADEDTEQDVQEKAAKDNGVTIWVTAWEELTLPELPSGLGSAEAFVLHSLLLHGKLREEILPTLLPCAAAVTMQALKRLRAADIIRAEGRTWQVTPLAYATARTYLRSEGYLVDEF